MDGGEQRAAQLGVTRPLTPAIRYADSHGANIAYRILGNGAVDLVVVPGFVSHLDLDWQNPAFRRFSRALARECRLIQFDKRGTGLSDPASGFPTIDERRDDLVAVLDAARSRRAVVFGLSDGGRAAIAFGASRGDRAAGLILYGTSYRRPPSTVPALRDMLQHWGEGHIVDVYAPSIANSETRRAAAAFERAAASPGMARMLLESTALMDVRDRLAEVRMPTLVIHREGDFIPEADSREVAAALPNARYVTLPGRDHLPWVGDWAAVVTEILGFVAEIAHRKQTATSPSGEATVRHRPRVGWPSLTPAERTTVRLVAEGLANRQIADRLFVSHYTVETHLKHVFSKLGVESRSELAALAVTENGPENT